MKAIVLDVKGRRSVVLLRNGTVRTVNKRYAVGRRVSVGVMPALRRFAAAAAAVAVLAAGCFWFDQNLVACAEVSIDVNPSIVYTLNRRSLVISVRAENEEAEALVKSLDAGKVLFGTIDNALYQTFALLREGGYIGEEQEDYLLVGVAADAEDARKTILEEVTSSLQRGAEQDMTLTYAVTETDRSHARRANAAHVSLGRYSAWQEATHGDEAALEDFRRMDIRDIVSPPQRPDDDKSRNGAPTDRSPQGGAPRGENEPSEINPPRDKDEPPINDRDGMNEQPAADERGATSGEPATNERDGMNAEPPATGRGEPQAEPPSSPDISRSAPYDRDAEGRLPEAPRDERY